MWGIIYIIVVGFVAGIIAKWLSPGPNNPSGFILTTVLGIIGAALATGRRGARTPAIVIQLLLLPVVYSLIGPSRQLLLGIAAGIYVVLTFLLLISERSREWATAPYSREP